MLTYAERLILWNQYEILKHLDKRQGTQYEENQEILADGYVSLYEHINGSVGKNEVSDAEYSEVVNILDMFRALTFASKKFSYTPARPFFGFEGFDGNNDHPQYGLAIFLRRTQKKWGELAAVADNSHTMSSLPRYRSMLSRWLAIDQKYELSADELRALEAAV
jgi:uncharacterized protein YfbU (UPF0304 family)